jgi:CRISPR/Cas system CSM-associated protein Csm2 small subunit
MKRNLRLDLQKLQIILENFLNAQDDEVIIDSPVNTYESILLAIVYISKIYDKKGLSGIEESNLEHILQSVMDKADQSNDVEFLFEGQNESSEELRIKLSDFWNSLLGS